MIHSVIFYGLVFYTCLQHNSDAFLTSIQFITNMPSHTIPQDTLDQFNTMNVFISDYLLPSDPALDNALAARQAANMDAIDVAPNEGKMLYLFAKMSSTKRVLEIGTLGGYSAIWFAKAIGPVGGKVITLELDPFNASVARKNIANAGFADIVEIKEGPALETLKRMEKEGEEKFDMVFLDADKENNPKYLEYALKFSKKGTVIVFDNMVRQGRVLADEDEVSLGVRQTFEMLKNEKRVECTGLQTVGPKNWDGFVLARVLV
jgi:predicted O-methyltransferase YrrM